MDLSSKEWTNIVFDGRNKDYGAYELRAKSAKRHNTAFLWVFLAVILILIGGFVYSYFQKKAEEARLAEIQAAIEQAALAALEQADEEEEIIPEENLMEQEPEVIEAIQEEILNTEKFTEFLVVKDEEVTEQVRTNEEIQQSETAIGSTDFDQGTDNLDIGAREHKDEVIVEEVHAAPEQVFTSVEQMPQFPGGEEELLRWISSHIKYPPLAAENNIQGRVIVMFVVTKDGSIGEAKIARSKDPDLDKEAIRVVKSLPKFNPGRMNGQPVNVWYTLPINFKLQGV